jgi:hypothetical protein
LTKPIEGERTQNQRKSSTKSVNQSKKKEMVTLGRASERGRRSGPEREGLSTSLLFIITVMTS